MGDEPVWLTPEGREKLIADLHKLRSVKRPEIVRAIAEARAHGDLSENAEYDAAKEAQGFLEKRIAGLETTLAQARIMEKPADDKARVGCTLTLRDLTRDKELVYHLVSEAEADFKHGKISTSSPVGRGLLGAAVGEKVEITVPAGTLHYEVLGITH